VDWVFGYASLVALREPAAVDGEERAPVPGRLRGYRRGWGVAMDNWDPVNDPKHFIDPETGERPRIRVAYLDVVPDGGWGTDGPRRSPVGTGPGPTVNGLALPVDDAHLAELDEREVNYERIDVTSLFEPNGALEDAPPDPPDPASDPPAPGRVFTYVGTPAAHERCRRGTEQGNAYVSAEYVAAVRDAFALLAPDALPEFDRTTDPSPFPPRDLALIRGNE